MLSGRGAAAWKHPHAQKREAVLSFTHPTVGYVHVLLIAGVVGQIILTSGERRNIGIYVLQAVMSIEC